jgi:hypothetical protein
MHTGFLLGDLRQRDPLEDLGRDGRIIKMDLQEVGWEGMDRVDLALDKVLVNMSGNPRFPQYAGNLTSRGPASFSGRSLLYVVSSVERLEKKYWQPELK